MICHIVCHFEGVRIRMDEKRVLYEKGEIDPTFLETFSSLSISHEDSSNLKSQEEKWRWNFDFMRTPTKKDPF